MEKEKTIRYTKNEIDSQNNNKNEEKKNETIQRLKDYEKQYNSLCLEYSENNIKDKLETKRIELTQLEEDNNEQYKKKLTEEMNILENLLKKINITISILEQEFDSFFTSKKLN